MSQDQISISEIFNNYIFDYKQIKFMVSFIFLPTLISISMCAIFWLILKYKKVKRAQTKEKLGFSLRYMTFIGYSFLIAIIAGLISGIFIVFDTLFSGDFRINDLLLVFLPTAAIFVTPITWFILLIILPFVLFLWQKIWNQRQKILIELTKTEENLI